MMLITEVEGIPITSMWKYRGPLLPGETVYPIPIPRLPDCHIYGYTAYGRIVRLFSERSKRMKTSVMAQSWSGSRGERLVAKLMGHKPEGGPFYIARLGCWSLFGANCLEPDLDAAHFPDDNPANNAEWNLLPASHMINSGEHRRIQNSAFLGEDHKDHKLTEEQVLEIRKLYIPYHRIYGRKALSRKYGIGYSTIAEILSRKIWRHI